MNVTTDHQDLDSIDAAAQAAAASWAEGNLAEDQALWECATLVVSSAVARAVAVEKILPYYGSQVASDVETQLEDLAINKIVEQVGSNSNLSLGRIARGESLLGWARGLMRTATASELRNYRRRNRTSLVPSDELTTFDLNDTAPIEDVVENVDNRPSTDGLVEEYQMRTWGTRPETVAHERGRTIARHLGIPQPRRVRNEDRAVVLKILKERQHAAQRAASNLVHRSPRDKRRKDEQVLEQIWSDYDRNALEAVATGDPRLAHVLAEAAATPRPPMTAVCRERLRRWCAAQLEPKPGEYRHWQATVREFIDAYVAWSSDGEYEFRSSKLALKSTARHRKDGVRLDAALDELLEIHGHHLGRTRNEVIATIESVRDRIETLIATESENRRVLHHPA